MTSRFYNQGYREGRRMVAPRAVVWAGPRVARKMTAEESTEYSTGWKAGHDSVTARDLIRMGYEND